MAQSLGEGIFALFGAPIAHEDHPQRALYAALRMQEALRRYAETLRREHGVNLEIRVGVNTGEVVVRAIRTDDLHTDYVPIGHSTSLAARLQSLASGGAIVVSAPTYRLTEGFFTFAPLGTAQIRGVSEPVEIYEVAGVGPLHTKLQVAAHRGLVRFSVFSPGSRDRPPPTGEIPGAAGRDEPEPAVAATRQARRSPGAAGTNLRLVHRGV